MKKRKGYKFFLVAVVLLVVVTVAVFYFDRVGDNVFLSSEEEETEDLGEDGASAIGSGGSGRGGSFCVAGSTCGMVGKGCNTPQGPGVCTVTGEVCNCVPIPRHLACINSCGNSTNTNSTNSTCTSTCQYVSGAGPDECFSAGSLCLMTNSTNTTGTNTQPSCTWQWGPELRLTNDLSISKNPSIVFDHSGFIHVVWTDRQSYSSYARTRLMYMKLSSNGSVVVPQKELIHSATDMAPRISVDSLNNIHILSNPFLNTYFLMYTKLDQNGNFLIRNLSLFNGSLMFNVQSNWFISIDSLNNVHVVFNERFINQTRYVYISSSGNVLGSALLPSNTLTTSSNLIVDNFGVNVISRSYHPLYPYEYSMATFRKFSYLGVPVTNLTTLFFSNNYWSTYGVMADPWISFTLLKNINFDRYHAFWANQQGNNGYLIYNQFNLSGVSTTPIVISNTLDIFPEGGFDAIIENFTGGQDIINIFWIDYRNGSLNGGVYYNQLNETTGLKLKNDTRLSSWGNRTYFPSSASSSETSKIAVAWEDDRFIPLNKEIFLRIYGCV